MSRSRLVASCTVALCVAVVGLRGSVAGPIMLILDDGGTHVINGPHAPVEVRDSPSGATTTLTIEHPAHVHALEKPGLPGRSVIAGASHGGEAVVSVVGGTLVSALEASDNARVTISDGVVGPDKAGLSMLLRGTSDPVAAEISGGTLVGGVDADDRCCLSITDGSIGMDLQGGSVRASGTSGTVVVGISGGTFAGTLSVRGWGRADVSGASFGADMLDKSLSAHGDPGAVVLDVSGVTTVGMLEAIGDSRVTVAGSSIGDDSVSVSVRASGGAVVDIVNSAFDGRLSALAGSEVSVSAGWVGADAENLSVTARGESWRPGVVDIDSGLFTGGVGVRAGGRVRVGAGLFGIEEFGGSVVANAPSGGPAVAQIFGGNFVGGFVAGHNATIHVYGQGLAYPGGSSVLTGTLADGTPLSVETATHGNGQIVLHDIAQIISIAPGLSPLHTRGVSTFWLPAEILPPPTGCPLGAVPLAVQGEGLGMISLGGSLVDVGEASAIVRRLGEATNPGRGDFQDTIPIELVALQLRSVEPMDLEPLGGAGTDYLFLTLQGDRVLLGPDLASPSTGQMTVDFAMRTFDSSLDVFFDVRAGSPDGEILFSGNDTLVAMHVPWSVDLPEGWSAIPGLDDAFFAGVIGGSLVGFDQAGQFLQLRTTTVLVPEPATLGLLALGGVALLRRRRRGEAPSAK